MSAAPPQLLLAHHLKTLKLPTFLREYEKVASECAREGVDHPRYLLRLAELELIDRERRLVERRIREARFPAVKSLDTFDFMAMPTLNKPLVLELARCEFIVAHDNIIVLGNSGTGKSHIALALGLAACQRGFSVIFATAAGLVHQLHEARDERRGSRKVLPMPARTPQSRRSTLLAHPGLTDSTCGPGPQQARTRSRDRPARPSRLAQSPGTAPRPPPGTRPWRGRPVAGLALLSCENGAKTGEFCRLTPLARKEATKTTPRCWRSPRQSQALLVAKLTTAPDWDGQSRGS